MHGRLAPLVAVAAALATASVGQPDPQRQSRQDSTPPVQQIGVIEGFYGTPWSHQDRLDMLRFMHRMGMNAYYYAPKNDPYHRDQWREPYPAREARRLRQLVDAAKAGDIAFYYSISPGLSMAYSDSADWMSLRHKIQSIYDLGVRHFALMLDDVLPTLTQARDARAFPTLADAHAHLINRLDAYLRRRHAELVVTPTTYTNAWGDRDYLRRLGAVVPRHIPFFWTGIDVASPEITAAQARAWAELIGRPPLIWDNYPVNDYARWRVFLGPVRGRARDLAGAVSGIIANPMNQAHASMLPLATLAIYGHEPGSYSPDEAIERAARELLGDAAGSALEPFLSVYGDYGWDINAFEPLFAPGQAIDLPVLRAALGRLEQSLVALRERWGDDPLVRPLATELDPIVAQTRERLEHLVRDTTYDRRGDLLVYRTELDRVVVPHRPFVEIDGRLDEWSPNDWRRLHGGGAPDPEARIALGWDDQNVALAIRVQDPDIQAATGETTAEGDHIAVVIDFDPIPDVNHIGAEDAVILLPAPGGGADSSPAHVVRSLVFHGFMAKNIAARRDLRFTEFLVASLAGPLDDRLAAVRHGLRYRAQRTADGYAAELAIPRLHAKRLRITVAVSDVRRGGRRARSLPVRNYPGNPVTFAELVFAR